MGGAQHFVAHHIAGAHDADDMTIEVRRWRRSGGHSLVFGWIERLTEGIDAGDANAFERGNELLAHQRRTIREGLR